MLEPLSHSIKLSLNKYNKTREPASVTAIRAIKDMNVGVHPMMLKDLEENEEELMQFRENLKNFKPKQSVLEIGIKKS